MSPGLDKLRFHCQIEQLPEELVLHIKTREIGLFVLLLVGGNGQLQAEIANLTHLGAKDVLLVPRHVPRENVEVEAEVLTAPLDEPVTVLPCREGGFRLPSMAAHAARRRTARAPELLFE
jgi:hypothetical protein